MTTSPTPKRLRTAAAAQYITDVHGLHRSEKTLRNDRALGKGPTWHYFGNVPYTTDVEIDRWVAKTISHRPANRKKPLSERPSAGA